MRVASVLPVRFHLSAGALAGAEPPHLSRDGRMMEKYDVVDPAREAGGGEYPTQDGFGWTNGVALALAAEERP
jgi:neutral trehalase